MGTQKGRITREWKNRDKRKVVSGQKNSQNETKRDVERKISSEVSEPMLPRKAAIVLAAPVP